MIIALHISSLHTFTITKVQLKENLNSAFSIIWSSFIYTESLEGIFGWAWTLWTLDEHQEELLYCSLTLGQNCPIVATHNWTKSCLPISPRQHNIFRYQCHLICRVCHKHLHNSDRCILLMTPSHNSKADAGKNTCTEQQYIAISNINDIKNIYTCHLTALVNILRHFCNSIWLLVSSALGNINRTLSFFQT